MSYLCELKKIVSNLKRQLYEGVKISHKKLTTRSFYLIVTMIMLTVNMEL